MYEAELGEVVGAVGVTGIGGFITGLGDLVDRVGHEAKIAQATAGSLEADLNVMANFYNSLSSLHTQLQTKMSSLSEAAHTVHARPAAGQVAGVQKAWKAIAESAGVTQSPRSLYTNLKTMDEWVQHYMAAILHNVQSYAQQEGVAIQALGRASQAAGAGTTAAHGATPTGTAAGKAAGAGW